MLGLIVVEMDLPSAEYCALAGLMAANTVTYLMIRHGITGITAVSDPC